MTAMASLTYLRDATLCHICRAHTAPSWCSLRPQNCVSLCGTPIERNAAHRPGPIRGAPECVVCIHMLYELKRLED